MIYSSDKQFKEQIRAFIDNNGIKYKHIAMKMDITPANFSRLLSQKTNDGLKLAKAQEILNAIGYTIDINIVPLSDENNQQ